MICKDQGQGKTGDTDSSSSLTTFIASFAVFAPQPFKDVPLNGAVFSGIYCQGKYTPLNCTSERHVTYLQAFNVENCISGVVIVFF